jgi:hypothetical protein
MTKTMALLTLFMATLCLGQPIHPDSTRAPSGNGSTGNLAADSTTSASSRFDLVPPAQFDSFLTILSHQGIVIEKSTVTAMGFTRDSVDTAQRLFMIYLDKSGQPVKRSFAIEQGGKSAPPPPAQAAPKQGGSQPVKLRQDGRVYFMINCAVKSLYVYPSGLSWAFPGTNGQVITGISLLALGASLYGSYAYTQKRELGYGRVEMMNYGGDLGVAYPLLLATFGETSFGCRYGNQLRGWGEMLGFPLGIFAGSYTRFAGNFEYGDASLMTSESKFGFLYGFIIPLYFHDPGTSEYFSLSTGLTMALVPAGFYLGTLLVGDRNYSAGRSVFVTTSAVLGAATGALLPTLWEEGHKEVYATTVLLGHVLGTLYGFTYMGDHSYSFGQGMFMIASAATGTAVAEAVPLIARSNEQRFYVGAGIVGSWGGLMLGELLARQLFDRSGRDNPKTASVSFPGLWQVPLLWACSKGGLKGVSTGNAPLVEVAF